MSEKFLKISSEMVPRQAFVNLTWKDLWLLWVQKSLQFKKIFLSLYLYWPKMHLSSWSKFVLQTYSKIVGSICGHLFTDFVTLCCRFPRFPKLFKALDQSKQLRFCGIASQRTKIVEDFQTHIPIVQPRFSKYLNASNTV